MKPKTGGRRAVNLTLSEDAITRGKALADRLKRPSLSNVVEFLIFQTSATTTTPTTKKAPRRRTAQPV